MDSINELRKIADLMVEYERKKIEYELEYNKQYREAYLTIDYAKSETQKKMIIENQLSKLKVEIYYYEQLIKELTRKTNQIKTEIDVVKAICFNLRAELKL